MASNSPGKAGDKPEVDPAVKAAKKAAKKEIREMQGKEKQEGFDHARFHELHYLAAGKPVPSTDPDDLD